MSLKHIVWVACCILMFGSCKDSKPEFGAPMTVQVFGVTSLADLTPGQKMGLYVGSPVNAVNIPMTVNEYGFATPDRELKWKYDQTSESRFFVYSPYNSSFLDEESVTFDIPADQSTLDSLLAGNVLTAESSATPKSNNVNLRMDHAMTAMTFSFDNRTSERITSVSVRGFMMSASLNILTGEFKGTGDKRPIIPLRSSDGTDSFCLIYAPQDVTPVFTVGFESGRTITVTYEAYCHEFRGKVLNMDAIYLTEAMLNDPNQNIQILPLEGLNVTDWRANGIPEFRVQPEYITLSELNKVEPDVNDGNFFSAYLKKVTVTAVDLTNPRWPGLILEDSTRAIHVWAAENSTLREGNTIVGPVLGTMDKVSDSEIYISNFLARYATVSRMDSLPCINGDINVVMRSSRTRYEYRRMLFRNVTMKSSFTNDLAVFVQGSTDFNVICRGADSQILAGSKGDLIGFPVWSGSELTIEVYDKDQFENFHKDPIENVLTSRHEYGMYKISAIPDTAVYSFAGREQGLQFSSRRYASARSLQVTHPASGEIHFIYLYDCIDGPSVGHSYNVAFNVVGSSADKGYTVSMECIKVEDGTAWLIDKSATKGLILPL